MTVSLLLLTQPSSRCLIASASHHFSFSFRSSTTLHRTSCALPEERRWGIALLATRGTSRDASAHRLEPQPSTVRGRAGIVASASGLARVNPHRRGEPIDKSSSFGSRLRSVEFISALNFARPGKTGPNPPDFARLSHSQGQRRPE